MKISFKMVMLFALMLFAFSPMSASGQFFFDENPLVGKQAPDFTLSTTGGEKMTLNQFRADAPAIVIFWATWCPSCREEMTMLSQSQEALQKSGIKIILVNLEESPRQVKSYINRLKLPFNVFLDKKGQVAQQFSVIGLPTAFFVNRDGVVVQMEFGLPKNFVEILTAEVNKKT